jgi:hypothetical protein
VVQEHSLSYGFLVCRGYISPLTYSSLWRQLCWCTKDRSCCSVQPATSPFAQLDCCRIDRKRLNPTVSDRDDTSTSINACAPLGDDNSVMRTPDAVVVVADAVVASLAAPTAAADNTPALCVRCGAHARSLHAHLRLRSRTFFASLRCLTISKQGLHLSSRHTRHTSPQLTVMLPARAHTRARPRMSTCHNKTHSPAQPCPSL